MARWGVIRQDGNRKQVERGEFVEQVGDARHVGRCRSALVAAGRVDDVRRGAGRHDQRAVVGDRAVVLRVAAVERELRRIGRAEMLDHLAREFDHERVGIGQAAMFGQAFSGLFVSHQQAHILKDFQRCLVNAFYLLWGQEFGKLWDHGAGGKEQGAGSEVGSRKSEVGRGVPLRQAQCRLLRSPWRRSEIRGRGSEVGGNFDLRTRLNLPLATCHLPLKTASTTLLASVR